MNFGRSTVLLASLAAAAFAVEYNFTEHHSCPSGGVCIKSITRCGHGVQQAFNCTRLLDVYTIDSDNETTAAMYYWTAYWIQLENHDESLPVQVSWSFYDYDLDIPQGAEDGGVENAVWTASAYIFPYSNQSCVRTGGSEQEKRVKVQTNRISEINRQNTRRVRLQSPGFHGAGLE